MVRLSPIALAPDAMAPELLADSLASSDRGAIMLWLRHSTSSPTGRQRLASDILRRSVFTQARLLGVVECSGCADSGCELCSPTCGRPFPW